MTRPHVLLAFPHNGMVSIGASRGYNDGCYMTRSMEVTGIEECTSFVPLGYNKTFQTALKARDMGGITHFAMIHADIEPMRPCDDGSFSWLDVLYGEMEETGATVVSAVSPIKEPARELTTTVIGDPTNPWHPKRHIKLSDRTKLPETFGIEHCGDPATEFLQVNTGCMLVDLRRPFWDVPQEHNTGDFFAFELMQRVIKRPRPIEEIAAEVQRRDKAVAMLQAKPNKSPTDYEHIKTLRAFVPLDYERVVQSRSEDWEMSRHVWQHGGICLATFKVAIKHAGYHEWFNQIHPPMSEVAAPKLMEAVA